MKRALLFLLLLPLFFSCKKSDDIVIAEAFGNKLYLSEAVEVMPKGLNHQDSVDFIDRYIQQWSTEKIVLHEAAKTLSLSEKNFAKELNQLKTQLLINAYYEKITEDTTLFPVTKAEIRNFMELYGMNEDTEKEIVKLNYVKLSLNSKLIPKIKSILFDEAKRVSGKKSIEKLCGDSIEYFIEDEKWLYLDDIEIEIPVHLNEKEPITNDNRYIETKDKQYHYLIVLLDYREKQTTHELSPSEYDNVRSMIQQQKKNKYIRKKIDQLYQEAIAQKKISN